MTALGPEEAINVMAFSARVEKSLMAELGQTKPKSDPLYVGSYPHNNGHNLWKTGN